MHPPSPTRTPPTITPALPQLLQTPSGLALLEIQGTLNLTGHDPEAAAHPIARRAFPGYSASAPADDTSWHKRVYLYVGKHQRLTGEVKRIQGGVGVLRRKDGDEGEGEGEELEIAEVVRWKVVFNSRPEPVGAAQAGD